MSEDKSPKEAAKDAKRWAEVERLKAEAREARARASRAELTLEREEEDRQRELAHDDYHRVYVFDDEVNERSVNRCIDQLVIWVRQHPGCDIEIQLNSPGGSIFDGFALVDFIRDIRSRGHKVTIIAYGKAASMAAVILQTADHRVIGRHAFMLIHEGSLGAIGDFGDVEDRVELMRLMHDRILRLFTERAKVDEEFIRNRWKRKDWWLTAEEALEHGFVDEVR